MQNVKSNPATINDYLIDKARASLTLFVINKAYKISKELGFGYVESDSAPNGWKALQNAFKHSQLTREALPVYSEGCETTIYTSREGNYAFRFWHDVCHVSENADFTIVGETKAIKKQAESIARHFGIDSLEYRLFMADTLGQITYYAIHKEFVTDQLAFVKSQLIKH